MTVEHFLMVSRGFIFAGINFAVEHLLVISWGLIFAAEHLLENSRLDPNPRKYIPAKSYLIKVFLQRFGLKSVFDDILYLTFFGYFHNEKYF